MSGFPARFAVGEACANLRASPVRTAALSLLAFCAGLVVAMAPTADVGMIEEAQRSLVAQGANLFRAQRADNAGLDAVACDALRAVTGVRAAGGVLRAEQITATVGQGSVLSLIRATPGFAAVMWPGLQGTPAADTAVAGAKAAAAGLVENGGVVPYRSALAEAGEEAVRWVDTAPAGAAAREFEYDWAIVVPAPPAGRVGVCLVEAQPGARRDVESILANWFDEAAPVRVYPLMVESSASSGTGQALAHRFTRFVPGAVAGFLLVVQASLWWARRGEIGIYGLLGLRGRSLAAMVATDQVLVLVLPYCAGVAAAFAAAAPTLTGIVLRTVGLDALRGFALLALVPLAVFGMLSMIKPFDAVRGR
jgi:hypothetical protein